MTYELRYKLEIFEKSAQGCASDIWYSINGDRAALTWLVWRQTLRSIQNLEWAGSIDTLFKNKTRGLNEKISI